MLYLILGFILCFIIKYDVYDTRYTEHNCVTTCQYHVKDHRYKRIELSFNNITGFDMIYNDKLCEYYLDREIYCYYHHKRLSMYRPLPVISMFAVIFFLQLIFYLN